MNKNDQRLCELLGANEDYRAGGIQYFDGLTAEILQVLIDEGFADSDEGFNNAPTTGEFLTFVKLNPEFVMHGYVVSPERSDYRVTIEGVKGTIDLRSDAFVEFVKMFREADEFTVDSNTGYCFAWYD